MGSQIIDEDGWEFEEQIIEDDEEETAQEQHPEVPAYVTFDDQLAEEEIYEERRQQAMEQGNFVSEDFFLEDEEEEKDFFVETSPNEPSDEDDPEGMAATGGTMENREEPVATVDNGQVPKESSDDAFSGKTSEEEAATAPRRRGRPPLKDGKAGRKGVKSTAPKKTAADTKGGLEERLSLLPTSGRKKILEELNKYAIESYDRADDPARKVIKPGESGHSIIVFRIRISQKSKYYYDINGMQESLGGKPSREIEESGMFDTFEEALQSAYDILYGFAEQVLL